LIVAAQERAKNRSAKIRSDWANRTTVREFRQLVHFWEIAARTEIRWLATRIGQFGRIFADRNFADRFFADRFFADRCLAALRSA
jgi:hypothetical protein